MFAITGKLFEWSIKEVNGKSLVNIVIHKKHKEKENKYAFNTFSEKIIHLLDNKLVGEGDSIEVKFFVKCREYNGRWYTDLYADQIIVLKRKQSTINMFNGRAKSFQ